MNRSPDAGMVESFVASEKLVLNFGRLLLVGMMACLAIGLQRVGEKLALGWDGSYLPWMAALVALDAVWTAGQVRRARTLELSVPLYRLVEWVVILALVIFWAPAGGSDYWTYRAYLREYVDSPAINAFAVPGGLRGTLARLPLPDLPAPLARLSPPPVQMQRAFVLPPGFYTQSKNHD